MQAAGVLEESKASQQPGQPLFEPVSDGARREIALDDISLFDYWPSLKQPNELLATQDLTYAKFPSHVCQQTANMADALSPEEFLGQVYEMKSFMSLVIKIGMMQLSQTVHGTYDLNKLYNSFLPMRQDQWTQPTENELGAIGEFDPNDANSTDFGPRIERFVH